MPLFTQGVREIGFLGTTSPLGGSRKLAKKVAIKVSSGSRDTYGDVLCLSACYRATGPGIRRAGVVVSTITPSVLGFSEGGNENTGVLGVSS